MGAIYQQAFLVIAAAGAHDSTEGLLDVERYGDMAVGVPYFTPESTSSDGTF